MAIFRASSRRARTVVVLPKFIAALLDICAPSRNGMTGKQEEFTLRATFDQGSVASATEAHQEED